MKRDYSRPDVWLAAYRAAQSARRKRNVCLCGVALCAVLAWGDYIYERLRVPELPAPPVIAYRPPEYGPPEASNGTRVGQCFYIPDSWVTSATTPTAFEQRVHGSDYRHNTGERGLRVRHEGWDPMILALGIIFGIFGLLVEQRGVAQYYAMASVGLLGYRVGRKLDRRDRRAA